MVIEQLDALYRDVILDHFKHSSHTGVLEHAQVKAEGANPLCGDELTFYLAFDGPRIARARFTGQGCAISQAAASMLAAQVEGKTIPEVMRLIEQMKALMQGREVSQSVDLGDLEALSGVRKFPVRVKCAALSWHIVEQGVKGYQQEAR